MNTRTTLILALVALVIAGYWFYSEKQRLTAGDEKEKPASLAKALYDPAPKSKDVDRVELTLRGEKGRFVFTKQDNAWQIAEPIQGTATEYEITSMIDRVGEIKHVKAWSAGDKDRPSDAVSKLDRPEAVVKLYTGEKLVADVMIGDKVPTGTGTYVKTGSSDVIYQANSDLRATFKKRLENLRDKRVVKFELKDVERVRVEGLQNYELSQTNGTWVVESPAKARGDKEQIEKVVRPISTLYAQDWKEDQPIALRPYQLDQPRLKVTIDTAREIPPKNKPGDPNTQPADTQPSTERKTIVLMIGGATDPGATSYFAKVDSSPSVFSIAESTVKELSTPLAELQDKNIMASTGEIEKIVSNTPDGEMTLTKDKGEWKFADGTTADAAAVDDLVKTLQNLKSVAMGVGAAPLVNNDWTKPRAKITVSRRGSVEPSEVLVGNATASGQMVYVKSATEGAIHKADADKLLAGPITYQDRSIFKFPQTQARRLEIAQPGREKVVLARAAEQWSMLEPVISPADADAARNAVTSLANLRAKSVVARGDRAAYGLDQPQVMLAVHTEAPAPQPPAAAPAVTPQPPVTQPAVSQADTPAASTQPSAAAPPPGAQRKTPAERIKQLEELLEYQTTTLRNEGKENPKATEMLIEELEKARREAGISTQPAIQGSPQAGAEEVASAATQPAAAPPPPAPEIKVYHLLLTQKNNTIYAAREDSDLIYEVDRKIFDDVTAEMHDRQILKFEVGDVTELGFEHGGSQVVLRKSGNDWTYVADPLVPIDTQKVTEVLNVFRDLKTHRYRVYKGADLAEFGLDEDFSRMWVVAGGADRKEVLLSRSGPPNDADKSRYATRGGEQKEVFLLKGDQTGKFEQKLEDFLKGGAAPSAAGAAPAGHVE